MKSYVACSIFFRLIFKFTSPAHAYIALLIQCYDKNPVISIVTVKSLILL